MRVAVLALWLGPLVACAPRIAPLPGSPDRGRLLLQQYACIDCHRITGVAGRQVEVGPPLEGVAWRVYIAGRLPNSPARLAAFIRAPQALVPGTTMPALGLSEAQAEDIAAYFWSQPPP